MNQKIPRNPDILHKELMQEMKDIASDYDLKFNRWTGQNSNVGRFYLNRSDRSAVCWIEENCSKNWIDRNIGCKLDERIRDAFTKYIKEYNAYYKYMETGEIDYWESFSLKNPSPLEISQMEERGECVKKYKTCHCVSCSEDRFEEANSRAMRMNVWDAEGHDFYDGFEG